MYEYVNSHEVPPEEPEGEPRYWKFNYIPESAGLLIFQSNITIEHDYFLHFIYIFTADSGGLGKKMDIYDIISNMENTPALQSAAITSDFIKVCYGWVLHNLY